MISKILSYRKSLGITQKQMSELLGISCDAYGKKERGEQEFKESEMITITDFFRKKYNQITMDDIFYR